MNRKKAREQAFVLIFESSFHAELPMEEIITIFNEIAKDNSDKEGVLHCADAFAQQLALGVSKNLPVIDNVIESYAIGWKLSRIPKVTLSILRMAIYEMDFSKDVPVSVTINEAVELSKKYSTKEDSSYLNGVLGSYARATVADENDSVTVNTQSVE